MVILDSNYKEAAGYMEVISSALHAKSFGVDGIFVMPPAGGTEITTGMDSVRNPEIWTDHVRAIAEATQLPLIIHPSHTWTSEWGKSLPIQAVKMILEYIPSVVGWKMIYSNVSAHYRVVKYMRSLPRHVAILNPPQFGYHTALMSDLLDGAVQGAYNFSMESMVAHTLAWQAGDVAKAKHIWNTEIVPVHDLIFAEGGGGRLHLRYKIAAWIRGLIAHPFMRQPMPAPRREEAEKLYNVMSKTGYSTLVDQSLRIP